ncbi:hypothetical protein K9E84_04915 [Staphylococcus pseudintermedius]|nr:hypothetical protein K9E84_04915 [Staphylococcus pseudintermedius]
MIHVLNFNSQIIDFISRDDNAVTIAKYHKTKDNDLLDIRILSQRAEHFKKRNRIIIQDKNDVYREYIIDRAEENGRYVDVECTASHLVDISTSKPIPPGKYEKMTINQKLSETLRDSGWVVGDCDYAGLKTNSWTSVRTPLEMISQLETAHEVQADYEIEIDGYEVVERRVNMKIPAPLFKGKEIEYGKDLLSMKRVIDFSEVKTALFALGPEPEQGKRVETFVYDDEAQEQFDLPYRYIWGVYEPETEDDNMSLQRLTTLAKTELNKRKSAAVSYEISVVDIEKEFPHEVIRYGDIVRIKNPDFTPTLYAESEVVGIEHDLISNKCTYEFGKVVEYQEDDLLRYFRNRLGYFNQKFNDKFSNVNTIVRESIEGELQYFERKILKGDTPPENPINDLLWLDTSNPKVAVLRRYWNGEWIKSSAENADDVGAITREQALYSELNNTFVNLTIQHSRLMHDASEVLESEYLVNTDIKASVNSRLNDIISVFNAIKTSLDSMTKETATIGVLVDTQALFLDYRAKMQALYNTIENAKIAIDERFKLLQSQYTDEKYNEAMEKIAAALPGGNWDAETGRLTGDIPNEERINEIEIALQQNLTDQINGAKQILNNQVDAKLLQLKDEITLSVRSVDEKIDGLGDGVNLLDSYNSSRPLSINKDIVSTKSFQGKYYATNLYTADYLKTILIPGETYTYSYEMEIIGLSEKEAPYSKKHGIIFYSNTMDKDRIFSYQDVERSVGNKIKYTHTFVAPEITDHRFVAYAGFYTDDGTLKYPISSNLVEITKFKLERGTRATPYTKSLNDRLEPIKIRTTNAENSIKVLQDSLLLTATKTDVQRTLDEQLKPLKNEVNEQKAQLQVMSDSIDSKVSQSEYTSNLQGVVERLDNAETHRQQLSNQITDRVTRSEYENDVEQRLVNSKAEVLIEAEQTSNRVSKEVFNESSKTLEKYTSEFINNVSTGMSFNYDNNGNIQSANVGPDGIKFDTTKFIINDGDVIIQNGVTTIKDAYIDKLFSKQATIEYLKATDIDLNRATVKGSKNGESTILSGGKIRSTGSFQRTFPEGAVTYEAFTESWNGVYRSGLISKQFGNRKLTDIERWLALTDKGITTQREIHSMSPDKNGARFIDFFADESYSSNVFGQGMHIYSGQAITIESEYGFSILSNNHSYIRTQNSGFEVNMNGGGLVLKRTSPFTSQSFSGGSYVSMRSSDNVEQGHVGILSDNRNISLSSSFGSVLLKGNKVFALDKNGEKRVPIYADYFSGDKLIGSIEAPDTNVYAMCHSELRVVSKAGYNGGDITYKNIRFNSWNAMSHEKFKHDIEEWNYNVLDIYKNELQLHSYKVNSEAGTEYSRIHHGIILRENSNLDQFPVEWRNADGFDGNEVLWWNTKAIQEIAKENDDLKSQIKDLKNKIDTILEMIK